MSTAEGRAENKNPEEIPSIEEAQKQIRELTKKRNERQTELLSLRSTRTLKEALEQASSNPIRTAVDSSSGPGFEIEDANLNEILLKQSRDLAADNAAWKEEALYRMAGLTTFTVQDPAPSGGKLLGVRIEIMANGTFGTPYYLFLKPHVTANKPTPDNPDPDPLPSETHLTLHRHTIPAYFLPNINALADKYLPQPPKVQNFDRFVRDTRRILVLHCLRNARLVKIKKQVDESLPSVHPNPEELPRIHVSSFVIDPEARLVEIEWTDSKDSSSKRCGWIAIKEEGGIEGVVVKRDGQRVMGMERQLKGNWVRGECDTMDWIDGLFGRLGWSV